MSAPYMTGSYFPPAPGPPGFAEPTLPRLTRLGNPTSTFEPILNALQQAQLQQTSQPTHDRRPATSHGTKPSLPALDTTQLPPLPLPPFQQAFSAKPPGRTSPSTFSSTSSSFSRRRSSGGSDGAQPPSSRSSASAQSRPGSSTKKFRKWGASASSSSGGGFFRKASSKAPASAHPAGQHSRQASNTSEWSWAPSVNPGQPTLLPRQYGAKPRSATTPVQRPPIQQQSTQFMTPRTAPNTAPNTPPQFTEPRTAPNSPPPPTEQPQYLTSQAFSYSPPQQLTPPIPTNSPPRQFQSHTAPNTPGFHNVQRNQLFIDPPDQTYRSSTEPQAPAFRSARAESNYPPMQRSQSPLSYLKDTTYTPPPLRTTKSTSNFTTARAPTSSNFGTPGPSFTYPSGPRHAHKTSSIYSGHEADALPGAFPDTPPEQGRSTPHITPLPPSRPMTPGMSSDGSMSPELNMTENDITAVWSHASLLYHNGKVADAVTSLHQLHQRFGITHLTMARLNINIGIMSESLSNSRNVAGVAPQQSTQLMIEAFQAAVKHSPDGPEGALATFLLGCALYDNQDFDKAASCFDMCEAIFGGEKDVMNYRMSRHDGLVPGTRPSALEGGEKIDLRAKLGMAYTLHLTMVRENYHVAQERSRIPAYLGTNRGLHRIPSGLLIENPFKGTTDSLSPLDESDDDFSDDDSEVEEAMRRLHESLVPSAGGTIGSGTLGSTVTGSGMELPDIRLDLGSPGPSQTKAPPIQAQPRPQIIKRASTKRKSRRELLRRQEARRTRILIALGDLRLNKPLPPLPHERHKFQERAMTSRPNKKDDIPDVPPLPVALVKGGMAFV